MIQPNLRSKAVWLIGAILLASYPATAKVASRLREIVRDARTKGFVARVDENTITVADLQSATEMLKVELQKEHPTDAGKRFPEDKKDVLRDLIDRDLLLQKAGELRLDPTQTLNQITQRFTPLQIAEMGRIFHELDMPLLYLELDEQEASLIDAVVMHQLDPNIDVSEKEIEDFYQSHLDSFKRVAGVPPISDVHDEIESIIAAQKAYPAFREYITTLRVNAFIDIEVGYVDTGADMDEQPGPGQIPRDIVVLGLAIFVVVGIQAMIMRHLKMF